MSTYRYIVTNIVWDTDDDDPMPVDYLPRSVIFTDTEILTVQEVVDRVSDDIGWCIMSCNTTHHNVWDEYLFWILAIIAIITNSYAIYYILTN